MRYGPKLIVTLFVAAASAGTCGCAAGSATPQPEKAAPTVNVRPDRFHGFDGYTLANGHVEVFVAPQIGRILAFRRSGGENVLWVHPHLEGVLPDADRDTLHPSVGPWFNYGGDKVWPWPQEAWETIFGSGWPPPADFDLGPFDAEVRQNSVVLTGPRSQETGVRVVRTVTLAGDTPRVNILTRLTFPRPRLDLRSDRYPSQMAEISPWHVTQIERDAVRVAVAVERPDPDAPARFAGDDPDGTRLENFSPLAGEVDGRRVYAARYRPDDRKAFYDADLLAASLPGGVFVQHLTGTSLGDWLHPTDRAQIYINSDTDPAHDLPSWTELEFAGPTGSGASITVEWTLLPPTDTDDPLDVARTALRAIDR